jgi:hypothetical protein
MKRPTTENYNAEQTAFDFPTQYNTKSYVSFSSTCSWRETLAYWTS